MWAKIVAICAVVIGSIIIIGCDRFTDDFPQDSLIEEIIEEVIEQETGISLDLTPASPE